MVQVVKFPTGSRCVGNLTHHLENQSNPDLEVSRDPDLIKTRINDAEKGQLFLSMMYALSNNLNYAAVLS